MHKVETLGRHILVEYYNCDPEVLKRALSSLNNQ